MTRTRQEQREYHIELIEQFVNAQKKAYEDNKKVLAELDVFLDRAKTYLNVVDAPVSGRHGSQNLNEQKSHIKTLASESFTHQHGKRRFVADLAMCLSGFGLVVGIVNKLRGKSFFFSKAPVQREQALETDLSLMGMSTRQKKV